MFNNLPLSHTRHAHAHSVGGIDLDWIRRESGIHVRRQTLLESVKPRQRKRIHNVNNASSNSRRILANSTGVVNNTLQAGNEKTVFLERETDVEVGNDKTVVFGALQSKTSIVVEKSNNNAIVEVNDNVNNDNEAVRVFVSRAGDKAFTSIAAGK